MVTDIWGQSLGTQSVTAVNAGAALVLAVLGGLHVHGSHNETVAQIAAAGATAVAKATTPAAAVSSAPTPVPAVIFNPAATGIFDPTATSTVNPAATGTVG